jgi:hypothetical protein
MNRTDITNITRRGLTILSSRDTEIFFYSRGKRVVVVFEPSGLTASMLDDMEASGIVTVENARLQAGFVTLLQKDFYDRLKFAGILYSLFEKYGL